MKRRSFLQSIIGGLAALFALKAKANVKKTKRLPQQYETFYQINYRGCRIVARRNRIQWENICNQDCVGKNQIDDITLDTMDVCGGLCKYRTKDGVYWQGAHGEIWKIFYVGGDQVFNFCLVKK